MSVDAHTDEPSHRLRIRVHPEPEAKVMVAIVAAVRRRNRHDDGGDSVRPQDRSVGRWGRTGRREAMVGLATAPRANDR